MGGHRVSSSGCRVLAVEAVAVVSSMARGGAGGEGLAGAGRAGGLLAGFRGELYRCLTARGDALSDLVDAVLCAVGDLQDVLGLALLTVSEGRTDPWWASVVPGRLDE